MKVTIKVFAGLNQYLKQKPKLGEPVTLTVPENTTVKEVIEELQIPLNMISIIFLNGVHASLDTVILDDATISLFPPVGGGYE